MRCLSNIQHTTYNTHDFAGDSAVLLSVESIFQTGGGGGGICYAASCTCMQHMCVHIVAHRCRRRRRRQRRAAVFIAAFVSARALRICGDGGGGVHEFACENDDYTGRNAHTHTHSTIYPRPRYSRPMSSCLCVRVYSPVCVCKSCVCVCCHIYIFSGRRTGMRERVCLLTKFKVAPWTWTRGRAVFCVVVAAAVVVVGYSVCV